MSVAIGDGALGLEATHIWSPPQGIGNAGIDGVTLNEDLYVLTKIDGLHGLPDIEDSRDPAFGRIGEVVYRALARGKTVVYSGEIRADSMADLRAAGNDLRRAFGAMSLDGETVAGAQPGEGRMDITPDSSYGEVVQYFTARALSLELGDEQTAGPNSTPTPYKRPFVLTLRLADPRVYEASDDPESFEGQSLGDSIFVTNDGSAPTDPLFKISGTGIDQVTVAKGTVYVLSFENLGFDSADDFWIDFRARRAWRDSDNADMTAHQVIAESNWWDPGIYGLDPGPNDIGVTATGASEWAIYWRHASW